MNPRNTMKGGKTSAFKHFVKPNLAAGESVRYFDFTSLYPSINASSNGELYPVGFPSIHLSLDIPGISYDGKSYSSQALERLLMNHDEQRSPDVFGLIHCQLHPPNNILHPPVGVNINGKLLFPLCKYWALVRVDD